MIKTISYSRVSSYAGCPQKHYFSYVDNLKPNRVSRPLSFGGDFHKLLEHRYDEVALAETKKALESSFYELPPNFQIELGDTYVDDLFNTFQDYMEVHKDAPVPSELELEFKIPMFKYKGEIVYFHGVIDEVYHNDGVPEYIGDHKTFSQRPNLDILTMNQQACLYAKAFHKLYGKYPTKFRWDYIKSKPASHPVWLEKSGRLSQASNSNITPQSWLRACSEHNILDDDMLSYAQNYSQNVENFFFTYEVELNPIMIESIWKDYMKLAREIMKKGDKNQRKVVGKNCSWCDYRSLCFAQFTGAPLDYIIEKDYRVVERNKDNEQSESED